MVSPRSIRFQLLLPLVLLTATVAFSQQENASSYKATAQDQQASKSAQTEGSKNSVTSHSRHRIHFHLGPVMVGAGYSYFSGLDFLPLAYGYGYPFWGYYGYAPFWNPGFYGVPPYAFSLGAGYGKGEVKLRVTPKTADLFIDDAYAGSVASLKGSVWLSPGAYNMCFKASGHSDFCQRIYVLSGKKLQILAKLDPGDGRVKP